MERAASIGAALVLSCAACGCRNEGERNMPPQTMKQKPEEQKPIPAVLASGIAATVNAWKGEMDIKMGFSQVARQLDSLCRNGKGGDLMRLHDAMSRSLLRLENEMYVTKQDLHRTLWEQAKASKTDAGTFAALFLALPRMENMPMKMPTFMGTDGVFLSAKENVDGTLHEAGSRGSKYAAMGERIRKSWIKPEFSSGLKGQEREAFFESLRTNYLKPEDMKPMSQPASQQMKMIKLPATMMLKPTKVKTVPVRRSP